MLRENKEQRRVEEVTLTLECTKAGEERHVCGQLERHLKWSPVKRGLRKFYSLEEVLQAHTLFPFEISVSHYRLSMVSYFKKML